MLHLLKAVTHFCFSIRYSADAYIVSDGKRRLSLGDRCLYDTHPTLTDSYTLCQIISCAS